MIKSILSVNIIFFHLSSHFLQQKIYLSIDFYIKLGIIPSYFQMEQVKGIEPSSRPWQGRILAVEPHLHALII